MRRHGIEDGGTMEHKRNQRVTVATRRLVILVFGITGLLGLMATSAYAMLTPQHCEPLRRR
jgi:hypothetical protein